MNDGDTDGLEGLPRAATTPEEASDRFVTFLATALIAVGWLGGAALAGLGVYCAVLVYGGEFESLPAILEEWVPSFRDHATWSALLLIVGTLILSLLPVLVFAGLGHLLRVFVGVDRGLRRLGRVLEERS